MHSRIFVTAAIIFMIAEAKVLPTTYHDNLDEYTSHNEQIDNHEPAKYKYSYAVEDNKTGDYKTHEEERDGDTVKGMYTVAEPNGKFRIVKYTVDKHSGFQAVVSYVGNDHHSEEEKEVETHHDHAKEETEIPKYLKTAKLYADDTHSQPLKYHFEIPHYHRETNREEELPKYQKKKVQVKHHKPTVYHEAEVEENKPIYKYVNPQFYRPTVGLKY